jgi:hypothetical protein
MKALDKHECILLQKIYKKNFPKLGKSSQIYTKKKHNFLNFPNFPNFFGEKTIQWFASPTWLLPSDNFSQLLNFYPTFSCLLYS